MKHRTRMLLLPTTRRLKDWVREVNEFSVAVRAVLDYGREHGVLWNTHVPDLG